MADLDRVGAGGSGCPEPDRPLNRPGERAIASASVTDTDLGGDVCEIEMDHTTVFVGRIGETRSTRVVDGPRIPSQNRST